MINGAHSIIYSTNAEADRAFLRDVLKLPNVDVGGGWLIFGLPPAEVAKVVVVLDTPAQMVGQRYALTLLEKGGARHVTMDFEP